MITCILRIQVWGWKVSLGTAKHNSRTPCHKAALPASTPAGPKEAGEKSGTKSANTKEIRMQVAL